MSEHGHAEELGRDRYGMRYARCECGAKYPVDAGCPHAPAGDDER